MSINLPLAISFARNEDLRLEFEFVDEAGAPLPVPAGTWSLALSGRGMSTSFSPAPKPGTENVLQIFGAVAALDTAMPPEIRFSGDLRLVSGSESFVYASLSLIRETVVQTTEDLGTRVVRVTRADNVLQLEFGQSSSLVAGYAVIASAARDEAQSAADVAQASEAAASTAASAASSAAMATAADRAQTGADKTAAQSAKTSAEAAAASAGTSAGVATEQAAAANSAASAASGSANAAASSATAAGASAANAVAAENAAAASEANALASKNAAASSAAGALASSNAAAASAMSATASAGSAATSEANALASKNAAQTSATDAAGSAASASASAVNAGNSATAAAGSAAAAASSAASISIGGSSGNLLFNNAGAFGGMSGTVWDNTNRSLTITGATVTASKPMLDLSQTWNNSAATFTFMKVNVTDTASNAASLLLDFQVGGTSKFNVSKTGTISVASGGGVTAPTNLIFRTTSANSISFYGADANNDFFTIATQSNGFASLRALGQFGWTANAWANGTLDTILTRRGAANLRLGAADAAAPVAQTLSVQSVVAGTSNTAGTNLTITGSQGTGTGAGGSIVFQTAPAGASGTAQNALVTVLTITSAKEVKCAGPLWVGNAYAAGAPTATGYVTIYDSTGTAYKVLVGT